MRNSIHFISILILFFITGCVNEGSVGSKGVTASDQIERGAVPKDRLVYKVMFTPSDFTMEQVGEMYKSDIATAGEDYATNLKNMWFIVLNKKLIKEGTDDQKKFYINEQLKMENNLPNIKGFYDLMLSSSLTESEKYDLAERFSAKNKDVVESLYNDDAKMKGEKMTELTYAKRNFQRFASVK